jgi:hypothetical protein
VSYPFAFLREKLNRVDGPLNFLYSKVIDSFLFGNGGMRGYDYSP